MFIPDQYLILLELENFVILTLREHCVQMGVLLLECVGKAKV